ncbi:MAG: cytochrome c [Saprospiraceae bacterium]
MKKLSFLIFLVALVFTCGNDATDSSKDSPSKPPAAKKVDDGKGVGSVKSVTLNSPLKADMVAKGKAIYEMKCSACHKLTDKRVVGPGWKGLTELRKPEWIMNMVTNVEEMLKEDQTAKDLLKQCLVRMPNQNLTEQDSRDILEFMFSIDGQEVGK